MLTLAAAKVVVLPRFLRGICVILLSSMPGIFALAYWVLPAHRQGESFAAQAAELTAQLESTATPVDDKTVLTAARPSRDDNSGHHVLRRYPVWRSDQAWFQDLVDLAKHQGVTTQELKHTGMRRKENRSVTSAIEAVQIENDISGYLGQRGYEWRMTGSQVDVSRLLSRLASRALWVDRLEIRPMADDLAQRPKGQILLNSPSTGTRSEPRTSTEVRAELRTTAAQGVLVQAVLTFRQSIWVFEEDQSLVAEHLPAFRFEQWNDSPVELPSLSDLFSSTNHTCVAATPHTLASTESRRVFADEALEQIRLVGVIEKTKGESCRVRRGIFRGPSGELVVAAHNAEVSSSGLRLVSLSKSRGVLYSEKLGSTVMRLEPTLMSGASYGHGSVSAASDHD